MNRIRLLAVLPLVALIGCGCGQKPPPIIEARPIEPPKVEDAELKPPAKPEASDAAAQQLLADMLAAHTGGKPDALAAFKECTVTRKGQQVVEGRQLNATWITHLSWPGRYRLRMDLDASGGVSQRLVFGQTPEGAWRAAVGENEKSALDPEFRQTLTSQSHEDALTLLFPFADPAVVVSRADGKDPAVSELHAWVPAVGYVRVGVDAKTKLLTRLAYNGRENVVPVMKELTFAEHKEYAGVKLGTKVGVRTKARPLGEWTELTVHVAKPDPKVFDGP